MKKYRIYALATASWFVGEYEGENKAAAIEKAENDQEADFSKILCHQCASNVELGDYHEAQAEPVEDE